MAHAKSFSGKEPLLLHPIGHAPQGPASSKWHIVVIGFCGYVLRSCLVHVVQKLVLVGEGHQGVALMYQPVPGHHFLYHFCSSNGLAVADNYLMVYEIHHGCSRCSDVLENSPNI